MELYILNRAMNLFDQVQYIPIYQSALIFSNIICGAVIMQESKLYTPLEFSLVVLGGCVALSGVWVIIKKPTKTTGSDDEEEVGPDGAPKIKTIIPSAKSVLVHQKCGCNAVNINF